jgi:hypothetical protein
MQQHLDNGLVSDAFLIRQFTGLLDVGSGNPDLAAVAFAFGSGAFGCFAGVLLRVIFVFAYSSSSQCALLSPAMVSSLYV